MLLYNALSEMSVTVRHVLSSQPYGREVEYFGPLHMLKIESSNFLVMT
jgi:hypothetical protein